MRTNDPLRRCLSIEFWPESDQRAWHALLVAGGILDEAGAGARWRPHTRISFAKSYGHWLNWLQLSEPGLLDLPADQRITAQTIESYITKFSTIVAPVSLASRIYTIWKVIVYLAPQTDWGWLGRLAKRLKRRAVPSRMKKERLLDADEIYARGVKIMTAVNAQRTPSWRGAEQFRDGLMLSLLISRPFRNRNFSAIEIGRHLFRSKDGYNIKFEASETKNHREIEASLPTALVPFLERYLMIYRPLLCQRNRRGDISARLWISQIGSALTTESIYERITSATERELGVRINPHCFRDCAATSIALQAPEHVGIIRHILGHTRMETSERHYIHADTAEATRRYQAYVLTLRGEPVTRRKSQTGR